MTEINKTREDWKSYLQTENLMSMKKDKKGNTNLIVDFNENYKYSILRKIENILFPYKQNELVENIKFVCHNKKEYEIIKANDSTFYKMNYDYQYKIDYNEFKSKICKDIIDNKETKIIEIIGDCTRYISDGVFWAQENIEIIYDEIAKDFNIIFEFGLTGSEEVDKYGNYVCDINNMVTNIVDKRNIPSIGNLVDKHSPMALNDWGCTNSKTTKHYILICDDGKLLFGGDVKTSDTLCDILIIVEGGNPIIFTIINNIITK